MCSREVPSPAPYHPGTTMFTVSEGMHHHRLPDEAWLVLSIRRVVVCGRGSRRNLCGEMYEDQEAVGDCAVVVEHLRKSFSRR